MKKYIGKRKSSYELIEPPIASGGEGYIYQVKDDANVVAKIFKEEKRSTAQQKKLELMVSGTQYPAIEEQSTWPKDLLYENAIQKASNKPIGYVMKNVENGEMLCVINGPEYKTAKKLYKVVIACNLCSAVDAIHTIGNVVGDLNPRNILINRKNTTVTLIDTDSYDVKDKNNGAEYPCCVGMGEYIAPELLKRMQNGERLDNLELPTFTKETDNFALAIHIFSLLMDGYHPFTCRLLDTAPESTPCPQKKESIVDGFSPYFGSKANLDIPLNAPSLNTLPPYIQELFRKAFVDGYNNPSLRPDAKTWGDALRSFYYEKKKEEDSARGSNTGTTGSGSTGTRNTGSTGSGNTGSGNTGSGNTGSGNTGSGNTGSGNTGTGKNGTGTSTQGTGGSSTGSGCGCLGCLGFLAKMAVIIMIIGIVIGLVAFIFDLIAYAAPAETYEVSYCVEQELEDWDVAGDDLEEELENYEVNLMYENNTICLQQTGEKTASL